MKKFFIRLGIFALIVIACDFAVGFVGEKLVDNAVGGDTGRKNYIGNRTEEDMLVFGSSRAIHHYDPDLLEDKLGLSVYNCGFDGNGIICLYGFFKMITERYYPKVLVYDLSTSFDLLPGDNHKYLGNLRYFYGGGYSIDSIFWKVDYSERYKMLSKMYRFNSKFPSLIMDNIHPLHDDNKGFLPLSGNMPDEIKPMETPKNHYEYDGLKLYYLERLICDCKGKTQLIFTISPLYENTDDSVYQPIKALCEKYGVPLLNHYTDNEFNLQREYFKDRSHLNARGALAYSEVVADEIRELLPSRP